MMKMSIPMPFGRADDIDEIWEYLESESVLILGPRRIGKTTVAYHIRDYPRGSREVRYIAVEHIREEREFVEHIISAISDLLSKRQKPKIYLEKAYVHVQEIGIPGVRVGMKHDNMNSACKKLDHIIKKIHDNGIDLIIILDELPIMLHNFNNDLGKTSVDKILQCLRDLRQQYRLKMIFCGSISIDDLLIECSCHDRINDIRRKPIGTLSIQSTKEFVAILLHQEDIEFDQNQLNLICNVIGAGIPYYVQIFVRRIRQLRSTGPELNMQLIKKAYEKLLKIEGKNYVQHYIDKLPSLGIDKKVTEKLLTAIALNKSTSKKELKRLFSLYTKNPNYEDLSNLVKKLKNYFYVKENAHGGLIFHDKFLRDLWLKEYDV